MSKEDRAIATFTLGARQAPIVFVRNLRARRYVLRLRKDRVIRVTIPRGGSMSAAQSFAERHTDWLERQFQKVEAEPVGPVPWKLGTEILFRGEPVRLERGDTANQVKCGSERFKVADAQLDLRPEVERYLRRLARYELPLRVLELATTHHLTVKNVVVRNQKSRWGSCSRRATISLNWRLIQTPENIRDYIILHELMHRRQMNHSKRFWHEVERVCPSYRESENWLKRHARLLR